ncbi:hypothetical protein EDD22DRAFT_917941, partial [Suillus occidentalis]
FLYTPLVCNLVFCLSTCESGPVKLTRAFQVIAPNLRTPSVRVLLHYITSTDHCQWNHRSCQKQCSANSPTQTRAPIEVDSLVNPGCPSVQMMQTCGWDEDNDTYLGSTMLGGGYATDPVLD